MKNHFQNDLPRVKTKICDEDLPMVTHLHIGFHEFAHQFEQVQKILLNPSFTLKVIPHGPHSLSQFGIMMCRRMPARPDTQFHMDSKA